MCSPLDSSSLNCVEFKGSGNPLGGSAAPTARATRRVMHDRKVNKFLLSCVVIAVSYDYPVLILLVFTKYKAQKAEKSKEMNMNTTNSTNDLLNAMVFTDLRCSSTPHEVEVMRSVRTCFSLQKYCSIKRLIW